MNYEEARDKAESRVYWFMDAQTIADTSKRLGFNVRISARGKLLNRGELEDKLIEYYTNLYMNY